MTSAPKCKVCGASHWGAAHVFAGQAVKAARPKTAPTPLKAPVAVVADDRDALIAALRARIAELEPDALAWRARKAANRDRMKKARTS